ncbi:hypothetical protein N0V93_001417 [Gnomoniopsis smithogilvyi]|uniref:NADP-dependent oxidoreductase domain-containing protein n=1 Tax=Gnomoniopsis smithogilvyi TaxID=1191159 RepID=A0A9W8Z3W1_9PEZI|nr:hypothetical protein N0V93_001417 [Gnomoniopsis smithogilvyi]
MSTTSGMKYTNLGQSGLRVSRVCVGCMSYGDRRGRYPWCIEEQDALPILQYCYESGINFFDTANGYSNGVSEEILGKAIRKYNWRRENVVIATKVWAPVGFRNEGDKWDDPLLLMSVDERERKGYINMFGLSRKHILDSVDASLKRLNQEYIDLLQIHRFDPRTPVKETMEALHDVVKSGKVRYIGASSMFAHELLEMQYTARLHGWTEFISMQNLHNAVYREEEREMIPSLKKFGMGMIPWSPVAMGFLTRPHAQVNETVRGSTMQGAFLRNELQESDKLINEKIEEIAKKRGVSMAIVAVAWSLSKPFMTSPILGMNKKERVDEAIAAVNFDLTEEEIESIDDLYVPKKVTGIAV